MKFSDLIPTLWDCGNKAGLIATIEWFEEVINEYESQNKKEIPLDELRKLIREAIKTIK